jgi:Na+/glutamate symporter
MNKPTVISYLVGSIFTVVITTVAALDAFAAGGIVLLASAVAGLIAGLCIGGLIAANFAMLEVEEKEKKDVPAQQNSRTRCSVTAFSGTSRSTRFLLVPSRLTELEKLTARARKLLS